MLSEKLRDALDNLLPDAGEDEAYLGTPTLRDAAVLIAFTDRPDPGVILTQRPQWLRSHAGQVAFPGGKIDPGDRDAIDAALREAEEEIGLSRRDVMIAGATEPYRSGSGYIITPVLGVIPPDLPLDPNPDESRTGSRCRSTYCSTPTIMRASMPIGRGTTAIIMTWTGRGGGSGA